MYIGFSATCHMMVVCTCSTLFNRSNSLWNAINHLDTNDKSLTLNLHFNSEIGDHIDFMQCGYIITTGGLVDGCFQAVNSTARRINLKIRVHGKELILDLHKPSWVTWSGFATEITESINQSHLPVSLLREKKQSRLCERPEQKATAS